MAVVILYHAVNYDSASHWNLAQHQQWWGEAKALRLTNTGSLSELVFESNQANPFENSQHFTGPATFDADGTGTELVQFHAWIVGSDNRVYLAVNNGGELAKTPYPFPFYYP